jgi:hypothetical protein
MLMADLLLENGIELAPEGDRHLREGWLQIQCPFCHSGKWHLGFHSDKRYFNCWNCGWHSIFSVFLELFQSARKAKELIEILDDPVFTGKTKRVKGTLTLPKMIRPMEERHKRYLSNRGYDPAELETLWKLQGIGMAIKYAWRIFVPIILNGQTVSWTTRTILKNESAKYKVAPMEHELVFHKNLLYGQDYCYRKILVSEGITDVWNVGPGMTCTFGIEISNTQISRLLEFDEIGIVPDNESNAIERATELAESLAVCNRRAYVIELDAEDPGSASKKEVLRLRRAFFGKE